MNFDLEYDLELFRKIQPGLFDKNNNRYSTPISDDVSKQMLKLIDNLESENKKLIDLLTQLRTNYLHEIDDNGETKASVLDLLGLWAKVNSVL